MNVAYEKNGELKYAHREDHCKLLEGLGWLQVNKAKEPTRRQNVKKAETKKD